MLSGLLLAVRRLRFFAFFVAAVSTIEIATEAAENPLETSSATKAPDSAAAASNDPKAASSAEQKSASAAPDAGEKRTPFDYEYFEELMNSIHAVSNPNEAKESERLCGLDSYCITLWKKGQLQVYKDGRLISGDFNGDGISDDAFITERDKNGGASGKEYAISITTKVNGKGKILMHQTLREANNIVEFFWDADKKAIVIDTGKRVVKTATVTNVTGSGFKNESNQNFKVVATVTWNPKTEKFDLLYPVNRKFTGKEKSESRI